MSCSPALYYQILIDVIIIIISRIVLANLPADEMDFLVFFVKTGDDRVYLSQDIIEVCRFYPVKFFEFIDLFGFAM